MKDAVKQHFFLYYPYTKKNTVIKTDGKTGRKNENTTYQYGYRNCDDRKKFKERFGDKWESLVETDSHYKKYREPPIPSGYLWIFGHFCNILTECERDFNGNPIFTFSTINSYEQCFMIHFSLVEKKLLFKMKHWFLETLSEMT